jgi:DNA modification methylase
MTSFLDGKVRLLKGDCLELLPTLEEGSIDSCCTDPPYGLAFMSRHWDSPDNIAFRPEVWAEVLRVLKPGAHLLAFSGTRTYHRMACAIEDAGFEIRDQIGWCYGSGFPKNHDVSKSIDKAAGHWRGRAGEITIEEQVAKGTEYERTDKGDPITPDAIVWTGWGTALKPSYEPIVLAQKPYTAQQYLAILVPTIGELICKVVSLAKTDTSLFTSASTSGFLSTVTSLSGALADLSHRASMCTTETAIALTIDLKILNSLLSKITRAITTGELSRINGGEFDVRSAVAISESVLAKCERLQRTTADELVISELAEMGSAPAESPISPNWDCIVLARKPLSEPSIAANVLKHGTGGMNIDDCRIGLTGGTSKPPSNDKSNTTSVGGHLNSQAGELNGKGRWPANLLHDGSEEVVSGFPDREAGGSREDTQRGQIFVHGGKHESFNDSGSAARFFYTAKADSDDRLGSRHPTVKPLDLIQYLVRLVTPKGGLVLDPFAGTGTTGEAAFREGFQTVLIEREPEYQADIERRMALVLAGPDERTRESIKARGLVEDAGPLFGEMA